MNALVSIFVWLCGFVAGVICCWFLVDFRATAEKMREDEQRRAEYEAGLRSAPPEIVFQVVSPQLTPEAVAHQIDLYKYWPKAPTT